MKKRILGIIGGSGLYQIEGLENIKWKKVSTSWGEPSDRILSATLNKKEVYSNSASTILGDPLNALLWYFDQKLSLNKFIKKNEIISLGSITPLLWINGPCNVKAVIDDLDECTINFIN